jgi:hypothetical protein
MITAVAIVSLVANLTVKVAPVAADFASLRARQRAVRAVDASLPPEFSTAFAQIARFISGDLTRADSAAYAAAFAAVVVALPKRISG